MEAAKKLLAFAERYGSLKLIANANNACDLINERFEMVSFTGQTL